MKQDLCNEERERRWKKSLFLLSPFQPAGPVPDLLLISVPARGVFQASIPIPALGFPTGGIIVFGSDEPPLPVPNIGGLINRTGTTIKQIIIATLLIFLPPVEKFIHQRDAPSLYIPVLLKCEPETRAY